MAFKSTAGSGKTTSHGALDRQFEPFQVSKDSFSSRSSANSAGSSPRLRRTSSGHVQQQTVDEDFAIEKPLELSERFVTVLDHLDANVEKLRRDALSLQEKRDNLLMSIDLIKSHDLFQAMSETEREEVQNYVERVSARLGTVELKVRTVRDNSQEDSLSQVNALIDAMITIGDAVYSRQRCQQYLNACCSSTETASAIGKRFSTESNSVRENLSSSRVFGSHETDPGPVDKKFESALLGCTLDDQKNIKKRLQALMAYLNKQTISQSLEISSSKHNFGYKTSSQHRMQ